MQVTGQERPRAADQVLEILRRKNHRRDKLLSVALEPPASKLDQRLLVLIKKQAVLRAIDTKLMQRGTHLRREGKVGGRALLFIDDDSQFIHDLTFVDPLQKGADKTVRDHLRRIARQKLRDRGDAVAHRVVQ